MREIKSRAWHLVEKRWLPDSEFSGINPMGRPFMITNLEDVEFWDDVEIVQYTGLKDKNGMEIYEGDLFSAWDGRSHYAVEWNDQAAGFYLVWVKGAVGDSKVRHRFEMLMAEYQFELVGNIYENPEFLKGVTKVK